MNRFSGLWRLCALLLCFCAAVGADETGGRSKDTKTIAQATGTPAPQAAKPAERAEEPARAACINQCNAADTHCNTDVRRARQECSKKAANAGRNPMTRRSDDYTYFCGYFSNYNGCGAYGGGCRDRFARRYGLCTDAIANNIAAMRYDCYINERDAQKFCRDELQDCKAACK
jgi:hypothetical protein